MLCQTTTQEAQIPSGGTMKKKLVIDMDPGVDDAQAIMMVLAAPNVEVLGFTCCHGNTSLERACKNTLRVLKVCGRLDIPVYSGCSEPLVIRRIHKDDFFGEDGLGDAPDPDAPGLELLQSEGAVPAIIRMVNENPGEVTLVAMAPLTNLALAVKTDTSLPDKLKALCIMGGNLESRGNITVCGEFNFAVDPESAYIVLNRYHCPTYIATWEFACRNSLPWKFCETWLAQDTEKARFMKKIFKHNMKVVTPNFKREAIAGVGGGGFTPCDAYAMAAAIDDRFVTESDEVAVSVELDGMNTRGMMVLDYLELFEKKHKAFVIKKVDLEMFKSMLMDALK